MAEPDYIELPPADPHIVKFLADGMLGTFEELINAYDGGGKVNYADGVMAAVNVLRFITRETVKQSEEPIWYSIAQASSERSLRRDAEKWMDGEIS